MFKKIISEVTRKAKEVERNRKFFLSVVGMVVATSLVVFKIIPADTFKDVFIGSLFIYSCANVAQKFLDGGNYKISSKK